MENKMKKLMLCLSILLMTCIHAEYKSKTNLMLSYSAISSSPAKDLQSSTFVDHRISVFDYNSSVYLFASLSGSSTLDEYLVLDLVDEGLVGENEFSRFLFGTGYSYRTTQPLIIDLELFLSRYNGADDQFNLTGVGVTIGLGYILSVSKKLSVIPFAKYGYESIGLASADGDVYDLSESLSGGTHSVGLTLEYDL